MDQTTIIDIFDYSLKDLKEFDFIKTKYNYHIIDKYIQLAIYFKNNNKLDDLSLKLFDTDIYKLKDIIFNFNINTISELRLFIKNIYIELNNPNFKILTLFNIKSINEELDDFIQNTSNSYFINLFLFNFIHILPISEYYNLLDDLTFNSEITNININLISPYLIEFQTDDILYLFFNILTYTQPILKDKLFLLFLNNYNIYVINEIYYFRDNFNYLHDDCDKLLLPQYFEHYEYYFYKKDDKINVLLYVALQSHNVTYNCIDIILKHSNVINIINILQIFENNDISINIFELILNAVLLSNNIIYEQLEEFNNIKNDIFADINIQKCEILESFLLNNTKKVISNFKINKDKVSFDIICYKIKNTNFVDSINEIFNELTNLNMEEKYLILNNFTSNKKLIYVDLDIIDNFLEKSKLEFSPKKAYILICNILTYMNSYINYKLLDLFLKHLNIYFTYDDNFYQIVKKIENSDFDPISKYFDVNNSQENNKFLYKALYSNFDTYNCIEILLQYCNTINILNIITVFENEEISINVLQLLLDNIDRNNIVLYNQLVKLGCFQLMCEIFSSGNYEKLPNNYEYYLKYLATHNMVNKIDILDYLNPIDNSTLFEKFNVLNEYLSYNIPDFKSSGTCDL